MKKLYIKNIKAFERDNIMQFKLPVGKFNLRLNGIEVYEEFYHFTIGLESWKYGQWVKEDFMSISLSRIDNIYPLTYEMDMMQQSSSKKTNHMITKLTKKNVFLHLGKLAKRHWGLSK